MRRPPPRRAQFAQHRSGSYRSIRPASAYCFRSIHEHLHKGKEAHNMNRRVFRLVPAKKRGPIAVLVAALAAAASLAIAGCGVRGASPSPAAAAKIPGAAQGLGQLSGILPASKLTLPSALEVNLTHEFVRLPLYPGTAYAGTPHAEKVWYILLDSSDKGLADDLGVNYAPKLANMGVSCPACVQHVTLDNPTPPDNPFGPAVVNFQGRPDFS